MREAEIKRKTNETDIELWLKLDGTGKNEIDTPTAQRLLRFCINASPAYVISAIGIGIFDSAKIGTIIF